MVKYQSYRNRILLHFAFWLAYAAVYALISTAFAAPSDLKFPPMIRFLRFWLYEIGLLPLKVVAAYWFLYYLVPKFILQNKYLISIGYFLLVMIVIVVVYRLQMFYVLYPLMYGEGPDFNVLELKRLLYTLLDIVPAIALVSTTKLLRNRIFSQQKEQRLINEKLRSELSYLRAQTNPHFLFNTLNSIYALARRNAPNTPEVVLKLSKILRFMLYECNRPRISIADELKIVKDYIGLEQLRYNERLKISYSEEIDRPAQSVAPLLLLPLIENAFKHGASEARFDIFINIEILLLHGTLKFTVRNSNYAERSVKGMEGIGISNVRRQLELIYPMAHQMTINNSDDVFEVLLEIELDKENGKVDMYNS